LEQQRRQLVAEALTPTRREDSERRPAGKQSLDDLLLTGAEGVEAEPLGQHLERAVNRRRRMRHPDRLARHGDGDLPTIAAPDGYTTSTATRLGPSSLPEAKSCLPASTRRATLTPRPADRDSGVRTLAQATARSAHVVAGGVTVG